MSTRRDPPAGWPPSVDTSLVVQLEGMGFSRDLAEQAVLATEGESLQAGLDWLLAAELRMVSEVAWGKGGGLPFWYKS